MAKDAETVLTEDARALRFLHEVLHGPAGPSPDRRMPTLRERFGVTRREQDMRPSDRAAKARIGHEC